MTFTLFRILAVLKPGPADAAAVLDALRRLAGPEETPSLPAFYRHVRSGVEEGWIAVESTEGDGGPGRPRQLYALTRSGIAAVEARARAMQRFTRLAFERGEGRGA